METKIRYALFELNGRTVFTIFDMDERFRCKASYDKEKSFTAKNGWKVSSHSRPDIVPATKTIYLRGMARPRDREIVILPEKHYIRHSQIHEALQEWAENWEGWKDEEEPVRQETIIIPLYEA